MNLKLGYKVILILIIIVYAKLVIAQGVFVDPNPESTERIFGDPAKKTSESGQAIYDEGGQNAQYRMTEAEKGLDFVKKEITSLKLEIANLKNQVLELENKLKKSNSVNTINEYKPLNKATPKLTPY
jgi:peptidoglycan hydrolase CwlO-like protein